MVGGARVHARREVKRDGLPPLAFIGELIGKGSTRICRGNTQNRWTTVEIYRTKGGRYVAKVGHFTCWQGESDEHRAKSLATPAEVIAYLQEGGERLGSASEEAVIEAAKNDASFAAVWVETVE